MVRFLGVEPSGIRRGAGYSRLQSPVLLETQNLFTIKLVEVTRIELATSCLQSRRSTN